MPTLRNFSLALLWYTIPVDENLKGKPLNVKTKPLKFLYYLVIKAE